jgi:hypothetical protein
MSKENFHRRFRMGSEAFGVLCDMASSKWDLYWAEVEGLKLSQKERALSLNKQRGKSRSSSLVEKAGLTPSEPSYYDVRVNLKQLAD